MASKIYSDYQRIFLDNWNSAIGNKILHLYFLLNLCEKHNRQPVMYKGSNLDSLFDFNFEVSHVGTPMKKYFYKEPDIFYVQNKLLTSIVKRYFFKEHFLKRVIAKGYNFFKKGINISKNAILPKEYYLKKAIAKSYESFKEEKNFFNNVILPDEDIMIRGHFWEYELMPTEEIIKKYLVIKPEIISYIKEKYPDIEENNSVAVHYRGTDFHHHLRYVFTRGIVLDKAYYKKAMEIVENKLGNNVVYHLFSDDILVLKEIFKDKNIVIHEDKAVYDWVALNIIKNVIQSNSSFCWTACLFNKALSIQPKDGYNYHNSTGSIPYGFKMNKSIIIGS